MHRCALQHCRLGVPPGSGALILIAGVARGYLCPAHWKQTILDCTHGKEIEDDEHEQDARSYVQRGRIWRMRTTGD